jgi:hypothetical protein
MLSGSVGTQGRWEKSACWSPPSPITYRAIVLTLPRALSEGMTTSRRGRSTLNARIVVRGENPVTLISRSTWSGSPGHPRRARSTIASQLYNAKEPMTLFELQAWLGHRNPASTQHYAKITPNTLSKAYTEAGYFARNIRTIEILLDREAVTSGAAANGEPWQYYDLGHGLCSYTFFEQCPHRMACAKCDFYTPKNSSKAQILEAKDNLQRMLASIPLTDENQAAPIRPLPDTVTNLDHLRLRRRDRAGGVIHEYRLVA